MSKWKGLGLSIGLVGLTALAPATEVSAQDTQWKLQPYLWFVGLDGTVDVASNSVPLDLTFSDYANDIKFVALVNAEVDFGGYWGIGVDFAYLGLGTDVTIDVPDVGPTPGTFDTDFVQFEALAYRSRINRSRGGIELLAGFRSPPSTPTSR